MTKIGKLGAATVVAAAMLAAVVVVLAGAREAEAAFPGVNGRLVFAHHEGPYNHDIYTINSDGTHPSRLTDYPDQDVNPVWSPDGRKVAFTRLVQADGCGCYAIFTMNSDGSGMRRLTRNQVVPSTTPSWSPDGSKLVFARRHEPNNDSSDYLYRYDLYTINADGTDQRQLTSTPGTRTADKQPAWSPDGTRIVFSRIRYGHAVSPTQ